MPQVPRRAYLSGQTRCGSAQLTTNMIEGQLGLHSVAVFWIRVQRREALRTSSLISASPTLLSRIIGTPAAPADTLSERKHRFETQVLASAVRATMEERPFQGPVRDLDRGLQAWWSHGSGAKPSMFRLNAGLKAGSSTNTFAFLNVVPPPPFCAVDGNDADLKQKAASISLTA